MTKISIITTVLNAATTIRDCLDSVINQKYPVEHIVVDGGSNDGTLEILNGYRSKLAFVVSESDKGLYDGMNKGIRLATGDVIGLLNADDMYANTDVLHKVAETFSSDLVDACYGDLVYVDSSRTEKVTRNWKSSVFQERCFYWGWMPPHPTFFVRRSIYEKHGMFNLDLGSAADYELMLRFLVKHKIRTAYIPQVLVKMRAGGASNASLKNRLRANRMDRKAWEINGLRPYPWTTFMKPLRKIKQYFVF